MLLPVGATTLLDVGRVIAAGAAAVLVDGPVPPGALGVDGSVAVPVVGVPSSVAARVRALAAVGRGASISIGAAGLQTNGSFGAAAPFTSGGLAFDGRPKPELLAPGVDVETSDPGLAEDGSPRYGIVSGSSVSAGLAAGAAALLAEARPDLDASGLKDALAQAAQRTATSDRAAPGVVDVANAVATEIVADPATLALGSVFAAGGVAGAPLTLRNVSRRWLHVSLDAATAGSGADLTITPSEVVLPPGGSAVVGVTAVVPTLPAAPGALTGAIRVVPTFSRAFRVPWAIAVPVSGRRLVGGLHLSQTTFVPSDVNPSLLEFSAGRVDGTVDEPQLLPIAQLEVELLRGDGRSLGTIATLRDVLPGRFRFGLTGRDSLGRPLRPGSYELRVVALPVGGGLPDQAELPFRIR